MLNTDLTKSEIKSRYAIRRRRQFVATIPLLIVLVSILIFLRVTGTEESDWLPPAIWRPIALLVLLWLLGFSLFNWRCPRCNAWLGWLGRFSFNLKHCSNCGVEFR